MVDIQLNKQEDYQTYLNFAAFSAGGIDFGKKITDDHPLINSENYKEYIDKYYAGNKGELTKVVQETQSEFNKIQEKYQKILQQIFGMDFSEKRYVGFVSIFNCNPRYVDNNTFQFYFKKDILDRVEVILHETLHFAFFKYVDYKMPGVASKYNKNNGPLWQLSEIFNVIVLNQPDLLELTKRPELNFYPELGEKVSVITSIWNESPGNLPTFINKSITALSLQSLPLSPVSY